MLTKYDSLQFKGRKNMNWFNNMTLKGKLLTGFIMVAIIAAVIGGIGILKIHQIDAAGTKLYEKITVPTAELVSISTDFQRTRVYALYVLRSNSREDKEKYAQKIKTLREGMDKDAISFEKTILTEEGRKLFADFNKERANYYTLMERLLQLSVAGNDKGVQAIMDSGQFAKIGGN